MQKRIITHKYTRASFHTYNTQPCACSTSSMHRHNPTHRTRASVHTPPCPFPPLTTVPPCDLAPTLACPCPEQPLNPSSALHSPLPPLSAPCRAPPPLSALHHPINPLGPAQNPSAPSDPPQSPSVAIYRPWGAPIGPLQPPNPPSALHNPSLFASARSKSPHPLSALHISPSPLSGPPKSASPPLGALSPVLCRSPLQPAPPPIAPPVGRNLPSPKSTRASVTLPLQCPRCSGDAPGEMLPRKGNARDALEMLRARCFRERSPFSRKFPGGEMHLRCFSADLKRPRCI